MIYCSIEDAWGSSKPTQQYNEYMSNTIDNNPKKTETSKLFFNLMNFYNR